MSAAAGSTDKLNPIITPRVPTSEKTTQSQTYIADHLRDGMILRWCPRSLRVVNRHTRNLAAGTVYFHSHMGIWLGDACRAEWLRSMECSTGSEMLHAR